MRRDWAKGKVKECLRCGQVGVGDMLGFICSGCHLVWDSAWVDDYSGTYYQVHYGEKELEKPSVTMMFKVPIGTLCVMSWEEI